MEPLPLRLIAWIFTAAGVFAVASGFFALRLLHKRGMLPNADRAVLLNDFILLGIWSISLFAGLGVLNQKAWALNLLEYFCWVLIVLTIYSAATRIKVMKDRFLQDNPSESFLWGPAVAGALIVVVPVTVFCAATIYTLRDEGVRKEFRAAAAAAAERQ